MSAIAGLLRFDGGTVTRHGLERAANALRQYGPDRADMAVADGIGLVHVLMRMTPEDQFDRQPWQGGSGALITADVRLDNRDKVLERIGVMPGEARAWPDSRVLLAGWEKLGDALWPILRGPFAVAIWDPRRRVLTLARDHLGLNVVMWHRSARFFAFATMPNGLFALDDVPRQLSEEKLADFFVLNHADHATTIYRNVFRLPPAHVMRIEADGSFKQFRYWSPAEIAPVELGCDRDYAEGLRERLDVAVRRQMRSAHPVGCLLSGGLDSSSVAALAARALAEKNERLAAFTGVPRRGFNGAVPAGHYADETPYVEAIARTVGNIDVSYVENDRCHDFSELERFFIALEGPVRNPTNFGWMLATLRLARRARPARAARRLSRQLHHELERLVAGHHPPQARSAVDGVAPMAIVLSPFALFALDGAAKTFCRAAVAGAGGELGRSPPPSGAARGLARSRNNPAGFCRGHGGRRPRPKKRP